MILFVVLIVTSPWGSAPPLQGAEKVMGKLGVSPTAVVPADPLDPVEREITAFNAKSSGLSVEASAKGWVAIFDHWSDANGKPGARSSSRSWMDRGLQMPLGALPRPETWPTILSSLRKRPQQSRPVRVLELLFDRLLGDDRSLITDCEALRKPREGPEEADFEGNSLNSVELPAALRLHDTDLVTKILVKQATQFAAFFLEKVPDIVSAFGEERSKPILKHLLEAAKSSFSGFEGEGTRRLAKSIMADDLANIKIPQWSLVDKSDRDLIATIVLKLGRSSLKDSSGSSHATSIYLADLLKEDRIDEAVALLSDKDFASRATLQDAGLDVTSLMSAISKVIDRLPATQLWPDYLAGATALNQLPDAKARLADVLSKSDLKASDRRRLLTLQGDLAAGTGDANLAEAAYRGASGLRGESNWDSQPVDKLLALAEATGSETALETAIKGADGIRISSTPASLFAALTLTGHLGQAQQVVLKKATTPSDYGTEAWETLAKLAEIYYRANRPADVLGLLDQAPNWPASDLSELVPVRTTPYYDAEHQGLPIGFLAGWAFAKSGRTDLAIRVLRDVLRYQFDLDEAYETLNSIQGASGIAFYDELIKTDPFAARPVAWKADLLRSLGKLEEAEQLARAAIKIDPTDGEAKPGRRLTSYAILAQILRARGNNSEADLYEHIVQAVRISEKADRYRNAGLLPQALDLYKQSSEVFANAYCIHARLALTLSLQGKKQEAMEHYRRAYELMPASFGEIESLCLGCEGAFGQSELREVAQAVFEKLAQESPDKPQIAYVLGRVKLANGDAKGALSEFERAVKLDPRYLNAWIQILDMAEQGVATPLEISTAAENVVRLDPLRLHTTYYATRGRLNDYASLWRIYAKAYASLPSVILGPLYPLHMTEERNEMGGGDQWRSYTGPAVSSLRKGPGGALVDMDGLREILQISLTSS